MNPRLAAIVLLATALRLHGIGVESFWYDESWSAWLIDGTPKDTIDRLAAEDAHPPLYYLLLSGWSKLAGTNESGLRTFSALLGVLSVMWLYRLVRRLVSEPAADAASLLLAISPFHVYFSQEARSYALVTLLAIAALDLLTSERLRQVPLALVAAALVYSHYMTVFFLAAAGLWIFVARRDVFWKFCVAMVGAVVLFLPWAKIAWAHFTQVRVEFWIPPVTSQRVVESLGELLVRDWGSWAYLFILWLLVMLLGRGDRRTIALGWIVFAAPIVFEVLASFGRPLFYTRTFGYSLVGAILLAAMAVEKRRALTLVLVLTSLHGLWWIYSHEEKEDWRGAANEIRAGIASGEVVVSHPPDVMTCVHPYRSAWPTAALDEIPADAKGVWLLLRHGRGGDAFPRLDARFTRRSEFKRNGAELYHYTEAP